MATAGPGLPPDLLAKRKRQKEASKTPPQLPHSRPQSRNSSPVSSNADDSKRRRTIGPAPPPAPISEKPSSTPPQAPPSDNSDSDSDSDFGPTLPPANGSSSPQHQSSLFTSSSTSSAPPKPQREEWMLVPPKQDDWSARVDPTKLRNRKFNAGKGAKGPPAKGGGDVSALWTETPEQKRQRLEDEMMGVKKPAQLVEGGDEDGAGGRGRGKGDERERRETERRIKEFNEKNRGASLYTEHKKTIPKEKEDDPSKRAFDKEKDMAMGQKIGHAKRKEMMNNAADFGSRFSGGKYL
ncbi:MAG: hypothetical protein Q9208_007626 [Pyrenodesmia sp. 3 TL-2023]